MILSKNYFEQQCDPQLRHKSSFLVRPCYQGRFHSCYESGFDVTTTESRRVNKLEQMRQGLIPWTVKDFYDLRGKQPVFDFMQTFTEDGELQWNGLLLLHHVNQEVSRRLIAEHQAEWHVVAAFPDPDKDIYFFVIDTRTDDFSEESFLKLRKEWASRLNKVFSHVSLHSPGYYARAHPAKYYDILDRDALFGEPIPIETADSPAPDPSPEVKSGWTRFFPKIFHFLGGTA